MLLQTSKDMRIYSPGERILIQELVNILGKMRLQKWDEYLKMQRYWTKGKISNLFFEKLYK